MAKRLILAALSLASLQLFSASFQWDNSAGGALDWATNANWNPATGFPNAIDDIATFGTPPIGGPLLANVTVTSAASKTVGQLIFGSNATAFNYRLNTGYTVNMSKSSGNPLIQVQTGSKPNQISSNLGLTAGTFTDIDIASGTSLTIDGRFDNGAGGVTTAGLNIINSGTLTISGGTSNLFNGLLTVSGGGIVNLNKTAGINAFGGSLLITSGTVKMVNDLQIPNASTVTVNGGTFDYNNRSDNWALLQFLSGSIINATVVDSLEVNDLVMRDVTLNAGLKVRTVGSPRTVTFDATNNGTAVLQGHYNLFGTNVNFIIGSGTAAIDMNVSSIMANGAITKTGAGTLELTGANTYTGTTTVSTGTLLIGTGGSLANTAVTVATGAILGGVGSIGSGTASVTNNGSVAPGLSPGVLTINGSYTQNALGSLDIELLTPTSFDQLIVSTGSVNLAGTLNVTLLPGYTFGTGPYNLTIIDNTAGTGVSGTFSTLNTTGFPANIVAGTPIYNAKSVVLPLNVFIPSPTPSPAAPTTILSGNSFSYSIPVLNGIYNNILHFSRFLNRIRPYERFETLSNRTIDEDSLSAFYRPEPKQRKLYPKIVEIPARIEEILVEIEENPAEGNDVISPTTSLMIKPSTRHTKGFFTNGVGSVGRVYSNKTQSAVRYYTVGGQFGFDYVGERFGIGFSPGYEYLRGQTLDKQDFFRVEAAEGTIFATLLPKPESNLFFDFIGGGACQWYHISRNTPAGTVNGKPFGGQVNGYGDMGYAFEFGETGFFTPFAGLGYVNLWVQGYQEKGPASQTFHVSKDRLQSFRSVLGFMGNYSFSGRTAIFIPEIRFIAMHEFFDTNRDVAFASAPLAINSQVQVFTLGRNIFLPGAILRFLFERNVEVYASYDYEWSDAFHSHLFLLGLEKRW